MGAPTQSRWVRELMSHDSVLMAVASGGCQKRRIEGEQGWSVVVEGWPAATRLRFLRAGAIACWAGRALCPSPSRPWLGRTFPLPTTNQPNPSPARLPTPTSGRALPLVPRPLSSVSPSPPPLLASPPAPPALHSQATPLARNPVQRPIAFPLSSHHAAQALGKSDHGRQNDAED